MIIKKIIFYLLLLIISSCSTQQQQDKCSDNNINNIKKTAWDADKNDNNLIAQDYFEKLCACRDIEGCLNAANYFDNNEPKWHYFNKKACDLGYGNACFWLGESTKGNIAKAYYENGCSLPIEKADGMSCRMAGIHNIDNYDKASSFFEKGCTLGDINSCVKAYKFINETDRKQRIKKQSCNLGIPEVCK